MIFLPRQKLDKIPSPASPTATLPFYSRHLPLRTARSSSRPRLSLVTPPSLAVGKKMPSPPAHGALGLTFTAMRAMQAVSLIAIIGLSGNFVSETVGAGYVAPSPLVGTLVVVSHNAATTLLNDPEGCWGRTREGWKEKRRRLLTEDKQACLASLYIAISYILYWDHMLPMLVAAGADLGILVAVVVVAVLVGKPVSYLACDGLPKEGNTANFIDSVYRNVRYSDGRVFRWVDPDRAACYEMKSLWGLSVALCVLFAFSCVASLALWRRIKTLSAPPAAPKDIE